MATGGFKLSLAGAKGKPGLKAPLEKPAKRRRLALDDDEPEDTNAKQEITGWDAAEGGAVDANAKKEEPKGPRIIPALPNRDWREEAQKRHLARTGAPPGEKQNGEDEEHRERPQMAFGLVTFDKKDEQNGDGGAEPMDVDSAPAPVDTRTEEEKLQAEAFEALVNGKSTNQAVIPISEEEALKNDLQDAPDAPTLAAYEATPIEGFGAALLRGMGWKDTDTSDKPKKTPEEIARRPALLGIGAKPETAAGFEAGELLGGKKGQRKTAIQYNPVALRNKRTGETITEEELQERLKKQKEAAEKAAKAAKNNTMMSDDDRDDGYRREKRREKKSRDRRDDEYDSERRRDKERSDDRREKRYDDSDRDRRRKKYDDYEDSDRDRRRDKYRDSDSKDRRRDTHREKRRERSRSPYDDDRRAKRQERDRRERSVDSKDDRREKRSDRDRDRDRDHRRRDRERSRSRGGSDRRRKRDEYYEDERDDRRKRHGDYEHSRR